jgi:long-chain acyl-CoA synthetase
MNIADSFSMGTLAYPERKALLFRDKTYTYAEMNRIITGIGAYLSGLGVAREDRIALYMPNRPEWIMCYYGVARMGAISVCVPAAYKREEMVGLVNDSRSSVLITSSDLSSEVPSSAAIPSVRKIIVVDEDDVFRSIVANEKGFVPVSARTTGDDVGAILYTGGTTGVPKGAMLTHRNLVSSAQNVAFHERMTPEDVGVCFMPLTHVFAQCHIMNALFFSCGTLVLFPGFDMDEILSAVSTHRVTRFYAVPTVYIRFLNDPSTRERLRSLRYVFSAATSMPAEIVRQWVDAFGIPINEAYGMTETASCVTFNHLFRHKIGSIGTPAGIVEVRLVDGDDNDVRDGERGEIVIRGPNVMKGYFNRPEETAVALRNGWLHSGDVGVFDDEGYLFIVDRLKDVIITGGENVFPKEVEDVLYMHEVVSECAVVGLAHPEYGEAVTAFVTLKEGKTVDEKALISFCKERLARYKVPKTVRVVAELPKTPQGKILRRELKKE